MQQTHVISYDAIQDPLDAAMALDNSLTKSVINVFGKWNNENDFWLKTGMRYVSK